MLKNIRDKNLPSRVGPASFSPVPLRPPSDTSNPASSVFSSPKSSTFALLLRRTKFEANDTAVATSNSNSDDSQLLRASPGVLLSLFTSARNQIAEAPIEAESSTISNSTVQYTIDSGSQIHLLTLEAARSHFIEQRISNLRVLGVLGVSGVASAADLAGRLILAVEAPKGISDHLDLGVAHGMTSCPMNLLSVSLLIKMGATLHFEEGNCFFRSNSHAERIPLHQEDGMFQLFASKGNLIPEVTTDPGSTFSVNGRCFATSADLRLWHRRIRHMDAALLKQISESNLVDGFKVTGRGFSNCDCDTCRQAKIRRRAAKHSRDIPDPANRIGHTVSTDLKSLPFVSFHGYRFVLNFVDHYSGLGLCYFLRHKNEVTSKLRTYISEMDGSLWY